MDYKKDEKNFYLPKSEPSLIEVPRRTFLMIDGEGDPNGEEFALKTQALYSLSYAVRMSYKSNDIPVNYTPYTVYPLEGVWDLINYDLSHKEKSNLKYTLMICQPSFLTEELFKRFLKETIKKKNNPFLPSIRLEDFEEGMCCQIMHIGSYDTESKSFKRMEQYCMKQGYYRSIKTHREIYLSDPRKIEVDRLKTVLRFKVEKS